MRHQNHKYTLGVDRPHRKSMMRNLASDLITHGKIKTTHTRCKALRIFVEKLVTIAKEDSVQKRRLVFAKINNSGAVKKLFDEVAPRHKARPGGYTRIIKIADTRVGDNAKMAQISFVD